MPGNHEYTSSLNSTNNCYGLPTGAPGYYQYFGLRLCLPKLGGVRERVRWLWKQALGRRSQRARRHTDWTTLDAAPWFALPRPQLTQRWV